MNDTGFRDGDITDENPSLLAMISDSSGINTVGNGIGHDLMAILDQDTRNPHILNDFYKSDLGTFRSGSLLYPFYNLTEGPHEIKLTAWDIHNNSASAVIRFTVVNSARPQISDFYNYPNPFSDRTWFVFGHNQPGEQSVAEIRIFDLTGRLIRTLTTNLPPDGYRSEPIEWDGTSDAGARIGKGMYICHLILTGASGNIAVKSTRLIITGIQNP